MLVQIVGVFEFFGVLFLGCVFINIIVGGIVDIIVFIVNFEVYVYGMVCVLIVGMIWQIFLFYMGLNIFVIYIISEYIFYFCILVLQEIFIVNVVVFVNIILDDFDCCCCW